MVADMIATSTGHGVPADHHIKKANSMARPTGKQHLASYSMLMPYMEELKTLHPDMEFNIDQNKGVFLRLMVLFPYSKQALKHCFNVVGVDSAHMGMVALEGITPHELHGFMPGQALPVGRHVLPKLHITAVTGRTMVFPKAIRFLCPVHIKRNLKTYGFSSEAIIHQFWKVQKAKSESVYNMEMEIMEGISPRACKYLREIDGWWQMYRLHECGAVLHEFQSDNVIEGAFGWMVEDRQCGSAYNFATAMHVKVMTRMNAMKLDVRNLPKGPADFLTPYAERCFRRNEQKVKLLGPLTFSVPEAGNNECAPKVVVMGTSKLTGALRSHVVDFAAKTCGCRHWEQSGVPCLHAIAYMHSAQMQAYKSYFYEWCWLSKLRGLMEDVEMLPPDETEVAARAASDRARYRLLPLINADATSSKSNKRIASNGDGKEGGGVPYSQVGKMKKVVCRDCGKYISPRTDHLPEACHNHRWRHGKGDEGYYESKLVDDMLVRASSSSSSAAALDVSDADSEDGEEETFDEDLEEFEALG
jgi:hypothetical protein